MNTLTRDEATEHVHDLLGRESLTLTEVWKLLELSGLDVDAEAVARRMHGAYYLNRDKLLELLNAKAATQDEARADEADYTTRNLPHGALSTRIV